MYSIHLKAGTKFNFDIPKLYNCKQSENLEVYILFYIKYRVYAVFHAPNSI